ncbi:compound eye opsin BCRH2 [Lepeophtheirus salmonis]|uniref:compound eye opsin BCRH2 n=1 Tax=Lepeophtheirus salmonis TaxID=72036 RepID=UPI001AE95467|nr:compound eye opsin BCRH2-like [Lepeophtheirus salmonis]
MADGSSIIAGLYMDETYHKMYSSSSRLTDGVPEELREVIHHHWDQFSPVNPLVTHFFAVFYFFLCSASLFGNLLVMYIFIKVKSLRTPSNMFVVNLALSDFCMILTQAVPVIFNAFMQRYWAWGVFGCKLYGFLGAVFGVESILTMVIIGYDRYNVIVKGMNGTRITPMRAFILLLFIWFYAIGVSALALFNVWGGFMAEGLLLTCSYDYLSEDWNNFTYIIFTIIFLYVIPLSMVFFFYSSIVKAVWSHELALKKQAKKMNVDSLRSNTDSNAESAEIRIAKVAITNVSLWAGIWTPYTLVVLAAVLGSKSSITPLVSQLPAFIAKTASCINPLVYAVSHPKYREALMTEVPCLGIQEQGAPKKGGEDQSEKQTTA